MITTLYENPSLNFKFFMRNKTNICRNFFVNNCTVRYLCDRMFISNFFVELITTISSLQRFVANFLRNASYACTRVEIGELEEQRTKEARIKLTILNLTASSDSVARLNGTDWFRASISKRRSMDLDTEFVSINTVYRFSLYPRSVSFPSLRSSWEFARRQSSGLVISG